LKQRPLSYEDFEAYAGDHADIDEVIRAIELG